MLKAELSGDRGGSCHAINHGGKRKMQRKADSAIWSSSSDATNYEKINGTRMKDVANMHNGLQLSKQLGGFKLRRLLNSLW